MDAQLTTCLWFDGNGREAAEFYSSIFPNSTINGKAVHDEETAKLSGQTAGVEMTVSFTLNGNKFVALNGGPHYQFSAATSFMINCDTQEEVDYYWEKLSDGGKEVQCGWLTDKFGVSWQVVPKAFYHLMSSGTPEQSQRVMAAMLKMVKMDIAELEAAFNQ